VGHNHALAGPAQHFRPSSTRWRAIAIDEGQSPIKGKGCVGIVGGHSIDHRHLPSPPAPVLTQKVVTESRNEVGNDYSS
jgi:hypothetical protein